MASALLNALDANALQLLIRNEIPQAANCVVGRVGRSRGIADRVVGAELLVVQSCSVHSVKQQIRCRDYNTRRGICNVWDFRPTNRHACQISN